MSWLLVFLMIAMLPKRITFRLEKMFHSTRFDLDSIAVIVLAVVGLDGMIVTTQSSKDELGSSGRKKLEQMKAQIQGLRNRIRSCLASVEKKMASEELFEFVYDSQSFTLAYTFHPHSINSSTDPARLLVFSHRKSSSFNPSSL